MPRLKTVDPATSEGRVREIFEGPLKGKELNIFKGMANSAAALDFYLNAAGALSNAKLTPAEQEIVQLAIAEANGCNYCQAAHTAIGTGAGLTEEQTVDARRGTSNDPRYNSIARFATRLHEKRGFVDDSDLEEFRSAGFTDEHISEVIAVYALATFTNYFNHVNDTTVDFPTPPSI